MRRQTETALSVWAPDQREMDIYRRQFAPQSTTDDEWEIFKETCRVYRISPIRRQIYLVGRWDNAKRRMVNTPQISIGTLRLLALRTCEFEGTTEPEWADEEGNWFTCWPKAKGKHPYAARVGIYRKGFRSPVWGVVYFHEVAQKNKEGKYTKFWEDSGIHQIGKCAEADGLRKAFEEECGGVYIHEEMMQADADNPVISIIPVVDTDDGDTNDALRETAKASESSNGNRPAQAPAPKPTDAQLTVGQVRTLAFKAGYKGDGFNKLVAGIFGRILSDEELKKQENLERIAQAVQVAVELDATKAS